MQNKFAPYTDRYGGRALLLFLLFSAAIYQLVTVGIGMFALICLLPLVVIAIYVAFRWRTATFWLLFFINYFIQWFSKNNWIPSGIPLSFYNEALEIVLLVIAIIDARKSPCFERTGNMMLYALMIWCGFCTLEIFNDTCGLGMNVYAWYTGARLMAFQILYAFLVYIIYIDKPKILIYYLIFWGSLSLFSVFWVWKQKYIGFTNGEHAWIYGRGFSTHIIQWGTLIRYFSTHNDAASFGIGIASTAVAFLIFALTSKVKKYRYFFLITGIACTWAMFPSGTRTAIVCFGAGIAFYTVLAKSVKLSAFVGITFGIAFFILAFTNIGNSNGSIRRMRTAFDRSDASLNVRDVNKESIKKYIKEAPWGIGIGMEREQVPANNKYRILTEIPPDSEYVYIWVRTGKIGIITFVLTMLIMLGGACWTVLFRINSPSMRGIGAGLCCAFVSMQLGGYANQILLNFPNCLIYYGGLSLVYALPYMEKEWTEWENKLLAKEAERKRLKLEKKKASRV